MSYDLNMSGATLSKILAYRETAPAESIIDNVYTTASPRAITAATEYKLIFDDANLAWHFTTGFNTYTGITRMYNFTDDIGMYDEFLDTPTIMALPTCWFQPSAANPGECLIRMYVNETVPFVHDQAIVNYQGVSYEKMGDLFAYYLGDTSGYQIKSKGVYFTFEFEHNGNMKDMGLFHYLV